MTEKAEKSGPQCRIGIDVGGTFTDLVLIDRRNQQLSYFKEPSTPGDPAEAVERGVVGIISRAKVKASDIELVIYGTTIGLNTIIQRKGAKLALVVSEGNRDIFEIGRGRLPSPFDMRGTKEQPLVPRNHVFELPARCLADGTIEEAPSDKDMDDLVVRLKAHDFSAVAVLMMNSYLHPKLEQQVGTALRKALPDMLITESAEIWPEIREYERALIAALNAYIHPLMENYLTRLRSRLGSIGVEAPIFLTTNNGGTLGLQTAKDRPIDTVLSGPASGVVASSHLASIGNTPKIITFDMGGTSSDMAVSSGGVPEYTTRTTVGDFPLMLPVVNVSAIGAGGGSIVSVDAQGVLKVGPQSAGAAPGPICYRRGGTEPTVTDCFLALGLLRPDGFLDGAMSLDRDAAIDGLKPIAKRIGREGKDGVQETAEAALRVAVAKMATEIHKTFAQRGLDPREFTIVAFGGAGPTLANMLAEEVRLQKIIVPPSPGTLCALGALVTDLKRDFVRTIRRKMDTTPEFKGLLTRLGKDIKAESDVWLQQEGDIVGPTTIHWSADLRYAGEAQEITVALPEGAAENADIDVIAEAYHDVHERAYGFRENARVELMNLRAQVLAKVPPIEMSRVERSGGAPVVASRRPIFMAGAWREVDIFRRNALRSGHALVGPAIVEQEDTTVSILQGWVGTVDDYGVITVSRVQ